MSSGLQIISVSGFSEPQKDLSKTEAGERLDAVDKDQIQKIKDQYELKISELDEEITKKQFIIKRNADVIEEFRKQKREMVAKLEKENKKLTDQVQENKKQIEDFYKRSKETEENLQKSVSELEAQKEQLDVRVDTLQTQNQLQIELIKLKDVQMQKKSEAASLLSSQIADLKIQEEKLGKLLAQTNETMTGLEKKNEEQLALLRKFALDNGQQKKVLEQDKETFNDLRRLEGALRESIDRLKAEKEALRAQISEKEQKHIKSTDKQIGILGQKESELKTTRSELKEAKNTLKEKERELEYQLQNREKLERALAQLEKQISAFQESNEVLSEAIFHSESTQVMLEQQLEKVKMALEEKEHVIQIPEEKTAAKPEKKAPKSKRAVQKELEMQERLDAVYSRESDLRKQLDASHRQIAQSRKESQDLQELNLGLSQGITHLQLEEKALQQRLTEAERHIDALKRESSKDKKAYEEIVRSTVPEIIQIQKNLGEFLEAEEKSVEAEIAAEISKKEKLEKEIRELEEKQTRWCQIL